MRKKKNKNITSSPLSDDLDFSCNEKGFRYYTILDSDMYDTQSKIQYVAIDDTPEKILLRVCNKAKVIGVSASSSLRTVTGNFDIGYLEIRLGKLFKHLTKDDILSTVKILSKIKHNDEKTDDIDNLILLCLECHNKVHRQ